MDNAQTRKPSGPERHRSPNPLLARVASWFAFGRNMHLIVASAFAANVVGIGGAQYLPIYIRRLGGTIDDLGLFFSLETGIMAVLVLVGGWLVDRFNRKLLFALTPAVGGLSSLLMALAPSWPWLIPGMALNLLGMSIGGPIFFSMTSDIAPPQRRAAYFGYQAMAFSICGIVGPLVGGFFFQYLDYRWFLAFGALLGLGASYLRTLLRDPREDPNFVPDGQEEPAGAAERTRSGLLADFVANFREFGRWAFRTPGVVFYMFLINLPAIAGKLVESYFSVYINEVALIAPAVLGVLAAVSGTAAIPANLFGGRLADAIGRKIAVSVAHVLSGFWIMSVTLIAGFPAFAVLFVFDGLVHGGLFPSIDAWNADLCPSRHRGTFNGVLRLLGIVLAIPAPMAGAWLWARLGPAAPIRAAAVVAALTGVLLFKFAPAPGRSARALRRGSEPAPWSAAEPAPRSASEPVAPVSGPEAEP